VLVFWRGYDPQNTTNKYSKMNDEIQSSGMDESLLKKLSTQTNFGKSIHCHPLTKRMKSERVEEIFFENFFTLKFS
jgi:hypothetical protein